MYKRMRLGLVIGLLCSSVEAFASDYKVFHDVLEATAQRLSAAGTKQEKFEIVSQPMNYDYLSKFNGDIKDIDQAALAKDVSRDITSRPDNGGYDYNTRKTNPLALAILLGKADMLRSFLSYVDNINSHEVGVWGWRQPYSLAHVALGPKHPFHDKSVTLETRLEIIDILAQHGADFNFRFPFKPGEYHHPPLDAPYTAEGRYPSTEEHQARAFLYGADPSNTEISKISIPYICAHAYPYAMSMKNKTLYKPIESIREELRLMHQKEGSFL